MLVFRGDADEIFGVKNVEIAPDFDAYAQRNSVLAIKYP